MSVRFLRCAVVLCSLVSVAGAAQHESATDLHGLEEVRSLSKLPPELAKTLGWQAADEDSIVNLEREQGEPSAKSFTRWFVLAGLSKSYAVVAIEERGYSRQHDRLHADAYSLIGAQWVASGEWVLVSRPHTIEDLSQMLRSPESQTATVTWREWQRSRDLEKRIAEFTPSVSYRPNARLRENNIDDQEVRQIQDIVRQMFPGAIVTISGVAQGCPCEDGPGCTAQVWTAVYRSGRTRSLELSDIDDHWMIGPVQQWYLDLAQLQRPNFATYAAYIAAQAELNERFPACLGPSNAPPMNSR